MKQGIYTLANDYVLDQVIALLNSIEVHGGDLPVCIIPYDDRLEALQAEIERRNNPKVTIFSDRSAMEYWDHFARQAWDTHPTARQVWTQQGSRGYHRFGTHRRYCGFSGDFEQFIYMDADTLLLQHPRILFEALEKSDCVVYDFQHKDLSHVYAVHSDRLRPLFPPERLQTEIFCSGLYATHRSLFTPEDLEQLLNDLQAGEAEILYPMAPDQTLINYMMMRSNKRIVNLALHLPKEEVTGCCVTSSHFQEKDHQLYDKNQPLIYLHYIGLSSQLFQRLCAGENLDFPYRDLFLHYRYLHTPEQRPLFSGSPKNWDAPPDGLQKITGKITQKIMLKLPPRIQKLFRNLS